jgi:uncharacterized membrane protein
MRRPWRSAGAGGTVTGDVLIRRPVHEVYRFYRDFTNLPRFLGDVVAVQQLTDTAYRWVVAGPFGMRIRLRVTVTEQRVDRLIRYRTSGLLPLHGRWEVSFAPESDAATTRVREHLVIPLGAVGRAVLAVIGKFPDREVKANLTTLQQVLEAPPAAADHRSDGETHEPRDR